MVLICIALIISCSKEPKQGKKKLSNNSSLIIKNPKYKFGTISKSKQAVVCHTFKLENKGKKPIVIGDVDPSCGCLTAKLSSNTILPNSSQDIKVCINIKGQLGHFNKSVFINSSAENSITSVRMIGDITE